MHEIPRKQIPLHFLRGTAGITEKQNSQQCMQAYGPPRKQSPNKTMRVPAAVEGPVEGCNTPSRPAT